MKFLPTEMQVESWNAFGNAQVDSKTIVEGPVLEYVLKRVRFCVQKNQLEDERKCHFTWTKKILMQIMIITYLRNYYLIWEQYINFLPHRHQTVNLFPY